MRNTRQRSKMQMESAMSHANPEVVQIPEPEEEKPPQEPAGAGDGEDAMVVAPVSGAADAVVEITVRIAKAKLHCPVCTLPLQPPIYQCNKLGHLACGVCRLQLPSSGAGLCYVCGHAGGGYARSPAMEDVLRSARVPCPHADYGCRSYVTYYAAAEHQRSCPHAPCLCSLPGCGFAGSPAALRDHMGGAGAAHAWPVDRIRYGAALRLRVPESDPGQHRRVLAAADGGDGGEGGDADGAVFFLAVGRLGENPLRVVSLVCARPKAAAAAEGPQYACTITVDAAAGAAESVVLTKAPVPSSAAPGETSIEEAASLVVLRRSLPGAAAEDLDITVRIDKIV